MNDKEREIIEKLQARSYKPRRKKRKLKKVDMFGREYEDYEFNHDNKHKNLFQYL